MLGLSGIGPKAMTDIESALANLVFEEPVEVEAPVVEAEPEIDAEAPSVEAEIEAATAEAPVTA